MVAKRTDTLVFTWATAQYDSHGFPSDNVTGTMTLLCYVEVNATGTTVKINAGNGDRTDYQFKLFTDPFTATLPFGASVTVRGIPLKVVQVHQYQKHALIWLD